MSLLLRPLKLILPRLLQLLPTIWTDLVPRRRAAHVRRLASVLHTCDNTFNRAVTVFLLVRHELQRVDQFVTQSLRRRMRSKDFVLHQHYPVSPNACWELSHRIGRHKPHTTNYTTFSFCCCRRHAPTTANRCNPEAENNYSAGKRMIKSHLPHLTQSQ